MKDHTAARKFVTRKEEAAALVEYALLLALLAVVCIAAIAALGTSLSAFFTSVANSI